MISHNVSKHYAIFIIGTHTDKFADEQLQSQVESFQQEITSRYSKKIRIAGIFTTPESDDFQDSVMNWIANQSFMGETYPRTYLEFEKYVKGINMDRDRKVSEGNIEEAYEAILTKEEMIHLGKIANLPDQDEFFKALNLLHQWGTLLFFEKYGRTDFLILDITFFSRFIIPVLTTTRLHSLNSGIISLEELEYIWDSVQCPQNVKDVVIQIWLRLNTIYPCYPTLIQKAIPCLAQGLNSDFAETSDYNLYYCPPLVPLEHENYTFLWNTSFDSFTQYQRIFTFESVPVHFLDQFIVRLIQHADEVMTYWRYGILGSIDEDLFLVTLEKRDLIISVRGLDPLQTFLTCLEINEFIYSQTSKEANSVEQTIPCSDCLINYCIPFIFKLEDLELKIMTPQRPNNRQWFVNCPNNNARVDISLLAPDIILKHINLLPLEYEKLEIFQEIGTGAFATIYQGY